MLSLIEGKRFAEALPYFKWLLSKRNDQGGFIGTQDTVIGLESLATYGRFLTSKNNNVELNVHSTEDHVLKVNNENGLVLQRIDLPSTTESVKLAASGHGFALFQLSYRYNLNNSDVYTTFTLKPKVLETTAGHLNVEVCSRCVSTAFHYKKKTENFIIIIVFKLFIDSIQRAKMKNIRTW